MPPAFYNHHRDDSLKFMRALGMFLLLIAGSLLLSSLINYPLYLLLQGVAHPEPQNLINTTAKLLAIPGFVLIIRHYGIASKPGLGYEIPRRIFIRKLFNGWLIGLVILAVLSAGLLLSGARVPKNSTGAILPEILSTIGVGLIGGLIIGFIEETFFRGGIYGAIRQRSSFLTTLTLSSLLYAAMHFISPQALAEPTHLGWSSGLIILSSAFAGFYDWSSFDSFLALFMVGALLSLVRERTGNIAYCIGLHAGWVLVIKLMRRFTSVDIHADASSLVGHYDGIIGYLAAGWLLFLCIAFAVSWKREGGISPVD